MSILYRNQGNLHLCKFYIFTHKLKMHCAAKKTPQTQVDKYKLIHKFKKEKRKGYTYSNLSFPPERNSLSNSQRKNTARLVWRIKQNRSKSCSRFILNIMMPKCIFSLGVNSFQPNCSLLVTLFYLVVSE